MNQALIQDKDQQLEEMIRKFSSDSVNQSFALNFMLGAIRSYMHKGNSLEKENLINILESAYRFSKVRK